MGRKLNLGHLSEEECERVLQVIQRDFELRQREKSRLGKIEEEIKDEDTKSTILAKKEDFNQNCCMRCFSRFFFIFNQKLECTMCKFFICKNCSEYDATLKQYVCHVCLKQKELQTQSCEWFYSNVKKKFKRFGSAKVVRSLHKRKTDSDSENDSGYVAMYSNSMPLVNKRTRQTIEGFFESALNKNPPEAQLPETFDEVRVVEGERLQHQLNSVFNDIHQTLENQNPEGIHDIQQQQQWDRYVDSQRAAIVAALSNMTQSLHIAVDNQESAVPMTTPSTRHQHVKQSLQKEVENYLGHSIDLNEETTSEYGTEDGSNTSQLPSPRPYEEIFADTILKKIIADHQRLNDARHLEEERQVRHELTKLSNKCTLSVLNDEISTTEGESETDMGDTSIATDTDAESKISEDMERMLSTSTPLGTFFEKDVINKEEIHVQNSKLNDKNMSSATLVNDSDDDLDDLVIINMGEAELETVELKARKLAAMSEMKDESLQTSPQDVTITVTSPDGNVTSSENIYVDEELQSLKAEVEAAKPVAIPREIVEHVHHSGSPSDSDATLGAESDDGIVEPKIHKSNIAKDSALPDFDEVDFSEYALERSQSFNIPLPSFEEETQLGIEEIDFDDISRHGDDIEDDILDTTIESEFIFGEPWEKRPRPAKLFDNTSLISAYDNLGEKKVGKDIDGPVFMFVPKGSMQSPRIGEREVEELSDLSENDTLSGEESAASGDEDATEELEEGVATEEEEEEGEEGDEEGEEESDIEGEEGDDDMSGHLIRERPYKPYMAFMEMGSPDKVTHAKVIEANVEHEYMLSEVNTIHDRLPPENLSEEAVKRAAEQFQQRLEERIQAEQQEDDPEDADPRFVVRPKNIDVVEGEVAKFMCEVKGTDPLDVFWYRDMAEIQQIEDGDHYELSVRNGKHILEIYNTGKDDTGQYLCIAVNELGQSHKSAKLKLKDNSSEKAAPEFLKRLEDVEVVEGRQAKFRCKLKGYPQPRVLWYKDGKKLKSCEEFRIEKLGNRDYLLTIEKVTLDDDAEYMVVAKNVAGEARSSAQLLVEALSNGSSFVDASLASWNPSMTLDTTVETPTVDNYPDTDTLLRIAEQVYESRVKVTTTAEGILQHADKLTSIHNQLDEMDKKLNNIEVEVTDGIIPREDMTNNNSTRPGILQEHEQMTPSTPEVTKTVPVPTIEVHVATVEQTEAPEKIAAQLKQRKQEIILEKPVEEDTEEKEVELNLSFKEFEFLYSMGKITREEMRKGRIKVKDMTQIKKVLQEMPSNEESVLSDNSGHNLLLPFDGGLIDCGLKRVDSKRYKRDYVINRNSPRPERKKWDVRSPSAEGTELVKATPAGEREEDLLKDVTDQVEEEEDVTLPFDITQDDTHDTTWMSDALSTEDDIYMTAGKVYSLEERIRQLEGQIEATDEDTSSEIMAKLEDEVATAVAHVTQSDKQVSRIENEAEDLRQAMPRKTHDSTSSQSERSTSPSIQSHHEVSQIAESNSNFVASKAVLHTEKNEVNKSDDSNATSSKDFATEDSHESSASSESAHVEKVLLRGTSKEEDVPESRTELDDNIELPSVKNLLSKFNKSDVGAGDSSVKREQQVYSLTGRDLPRGMREKLQQRHAPPPTNTNVRVDNRSGPKQRSGIMSLFDDSELKVQDIPDPPKGAHKLDSSAVHPRSSTPMFSTPHVKSPLSKDSTFPPSPISSEASGSPSFSKKSPSPSKHDISKAATRGAAAATNVTVSQSSVVLRNKSEQSDPSVRPKSLRKSGNSAIMARAAFWDQRINEGQTTDGESILQDFPDLPEESFKKSSEL